MFPLGTVLFPTMMLPLHIFEPRYLQMIRECEATGEPFGVVLIERGFEVGGGDQRFSTGTMASILESADLEGDRRVLVAVGTERFAIQEWLEEAPYPRARVVPLGRAQGDFEPAIDVLDGLLRRMLALVSESGIDVGDLGYELSDDPVVALDQLCALAPLATLDRQQLLEVESLDAQAQLLAEMLSEANLLLQAQLGIG